MDEDEAQEIAEKYAEVLGVPMHIVCDEEYGYTHDDSGEWRVWRPVEVAP